MNVRKAAGPDGITGRVLRSCADQLAGLFTSIFNESLATSVVPTSFKKSVIIPVPKNSKPSCLNDYRPVTLTSTVMKVFERLLKKHICSFIPATLDLPILGYFLFSFSPYLYIYSLVLCFIVLLPFMFFYFYFYFYFIFALSIERTCPDLHFTTDYTLYDCVCDK